jgi:octaheme c-type cytochrome (tetrathionate reductase family)
MSEVSMKRFTTLFFIHWMGIAILFLALTMPVRIVEVSAQVRVVDENQPMGRALAQQATKGREIWITADHSLHKPLNKAFTSGPEVTEACLSCHELAAGQFQKTIHWTWLDPNVDPVLKVGKAGLTVNNFCINILSNEPRCTSCHAGYGWKDKNFDFSNPHLVDCLVCHEQTGTYKKFPTAAGYTVDKPTLFKPNGKTYLPPDWNAVSQSVGRPTRKNCGTCHFTGGGGDGVKHGDLDSSLIKPNKELDVHMGVDGQNFDCVRCHTTRVHHISGRIYSTPAATERKSLIEDDLTPKILCESCHSRTPHKPGVKANDHTDKVACQSCHIPAFARVNPTKMWWDWSKAGDKKNGKPYQKKGDLNKPIYDTKKGEFVWAKNVVPTYYWFNGSINTLTALDTIDPTGEVKVSWPVGDMADPNSRIFPFKIHRGKQAYDKVHKTLLIPHLFGKPGSGAYWAHYDWPLAFKSAMAYAGLPFSGEFDWVETAYVFPTTHMVTPKDKALACSQCHAQQGRLANLTGFYMPGRDANVVITSLGWIAVLVSLIGAFIHGIGRMITRFRKE